MDTDLPSMFFFQNKQRQQFSLLKTKIRTFSTKKSTSHWKDWSSSRGLTHFPPLIPAAVWLRHKSGGMDKKIFLTLPCTPQKRFYKNRKSCKKARQSVKLSGMANGSTNSTLATNNFKKPKTFYQQSLLNKVFITVGIVYSYTLKFMNLELPYSIFK